jgi:predicted amidohydrolase
MMTHKIALAQFHVEIGAPDANFTTAIRYIDQAVREGCGLIVLPELWTSGYDLEHAETYIELNQEILAELQDRVDQTGILIGGSYLTLENGGVFNTFILLQPGRARPLRYHKIHLFRPLDEPRYLRSGSSPAFGSTPLGKAGVAICYDLRFPEMFRVYGREQVDLLLVAAQWGAERADHWRTFLRARAIENQFFAAAANAVGPLRDKTLAGFSAVIDPWGETLVEADGSEETLLVAEIDLGAVRAAGERIPSREDARNDLYPGWFRPGSSAENPS